MDQRTARLGVASCTIEVTPPKGKSVSISSSARRMSQAVSWLLENPVAVWVTVGIAVSVVQHVREIKLIEKRAADIHAQVQRLEMLILTSAH